MKDRGITIIIPINYNGPKLYPVISTLIFTIKTKYQIIAVYDHDDDVSHPTLDRIIYSNNNITKLKNKYGEGPITAVRTGLNSAKYEYFIVWMSYHLDPEGKLNEMIEIMNSGANLVSANRFSSRYSHGRGSKLKLIMSKYGNFFLKIITKSNMSDFTTSIKIFRTEDLKKFNKKINFDYPGWSVITFWTLQILNEEMKYEEVDFGENNLQFIFGKSNFNIFKSIRGYINCITFAFSIRMKSK